MTCFVLFRNQTRQGNASKQKAPKAAAL